MLRGRGHYASVKVILVSQPSPEQRMLMVVLYFDDPITALWIHVKLEVFEGVDRNGISSGVSSIDAETNEIHPLQELSMPKRVSSLCKGS